MNTTPDHYDYEDRFWLLVEITARNLFGADLRIVAEKRRKIANLSWERRRFFYNSAPLDIAAGLLSKEPTLEQIYEYKILEDRLINDPLGQLFSKAVKLKTSTLQHNKLNALLAKAKESVSEFGWIVDPRF